MSLKSSERRQVALVIAPPVLLASTYLCYQRLVARLGRKAGYLGGFLFYWIVWCLLFPAWVLGPGGIGRLFRERQPPFGQARRLTLALLGVPLLLGYGAEFPRAIRQADRRVLLVSVPIAVINGALEELLWRGTYLAVFPDRPVRGWLYPSLGFAVWHFAPQSIFPSPRPGGNVLLVIVAGLVGLMWGWVARETGSIRWTTVAHVLFDYSGLGARVYLRPARGER